MGHVADCTGHDQRDRFVCQAVYTDLFYCGGNSPGHGHRCMLLSAYAGDRLSGGKLFKRGLASFCLQLCTSCHFKWNLGGGKTFPVIGFFEKGDRGSAENFYGCGYGIQPGAVCCGAGGGQAEDIGAPESGSFHPGDWRCCGRGDRAGLRVGGVDKKQHGSFIFTAFSGKRTDSPDQTAFDRGNSQTGGSNCGHCK